MLLLFFILLAGLSVFAIIQTKKYAKANKLFNQAQAIEIQYTKTPYDFSKLKDALAIYKQCNNLVNSSVHTKAINDCQQKIDSCLKFQSLMAIGKEQAKNYYFKNALRNFNQAEKLFPTSTIKDDINRCYRGIEQQNRYEQIIEKSNSMAREGNFRKAIDLLIPAVKNFPRQDGEQLLDKLKLVVKARDLYQSGLIAEHKREIRDAIANYKQSLNLLPEYIECRLRLAIVTVENNPQQAINYLTKAKGKQANYIRGFAYARLGNWRQAKREWSVLDYSAIEIQCNIINSLIERERFVLKHEIEQSVDSENLEIAKFLSIYLIETNNSDSIVENNLECHIIPSLKYQIWKNENWQEIANYTEKAWQEKQDIKSLHNWAIATYYQYQIDSNKITDFMIVWSTALANLKLDYSLQDIPWMGNNSVDFEDVTQKLKEILENAIDAVKDKDIEEYLNLRDIYRKDVVMLSLTEKKDCGIKAKTGLLILPNCYLQFQKHFSRSKLPNTVWGTLYTDWGEAVAACYEKDVIRAIKIKPKKSPSSEIEHLAYAFISYHEGCHYLENQYWRKAIAILQEAKLEIVAKPDWCSEIDRLCNIQRQYIGEFAEHLEFSKSWYLLIGSKAAKSYYVEHQSMQIGMDADNKKISFKQAIKKLKELRNIDPDNLVTSDIIGTLEINLELETINLLWQQSQYEEAVILAKRSHHEKVRFAVAEVCLEIVLEILKSGNLTYESLQSLQKITQWAYELCPQEPLFQITYSQLKQLGIHR